MANAKQEVFKLLETLPEEASLAQGLRSDGLLNPLIPFPHWEWDPESSQGMAPAQTGEPAEAAVGGDPLAS
jgi:hypothetical protein